MSKSYLEQNKDCKSYIQKDSYIKSNIDKKPYLSYATLPEEYDVFSELKLEVLEDAYKEQLLLLEDFLNGLKEKLKYLVMVQGVVRILPKLSLAKDKDDAFIVNWAYSNYRIFINIEKKIEDSFYGIIAQDEEKNVFSNSGKFDESNYNLVTNKILDYIFNQT